MFFAMQCLLKHSLLLMRRFATRRASNVTVKAGTIADSLAEYGVGYLDITWNKLLLNFRKPHE